MTRALAIPEDGRVVTLCCGGHHPASDCACCAECTTNADLGRLTPGVRAVIAHNERVHATALRLNLRRAEQLAVMADLVAIRDQRLRHLGLAFAGAVAALTGSPQEPPNRWFSRSGVLS